MKFIRRSVEFFCWLWLLATTPPDSPEQPDPEMNKKLKSLLDVAWLKWLWSVKSLLVIIALVLAGFVALPRLLHAADSTAAPLDLGVLSFIGVAVVAVPVVVLAFWALVKSEFPVIDKWVDGDLENDEALPSEERVSLRRDWLRMSPAERVHGFFGLMAFVILAGALVVVAAF